MITVVAGRYASEVRPVIVVMSKINPSPCTAASASVAAADPSIDVTTAARAPARSASLPPSGPAAILPTA